MYFGRCECAATLTRGPEASAALCFPTTSRLTRRWLTARRREPDRPSDRSSKRPGPRKWRTPISVRAAAARNASVSRARFVWRVSEWQVNEWARLSLPAAYLLGEEGPSWVWALAVPVVVGWDLGAWARCPSEGMNARGPSAQLEGNRSCY